MTAKSFLYHKPSEQSIATIAKVREAFIITDEILNKLCPQSRERSIALTELETAAMWAVKSIVCNDPESVPEEL